MKEGEATAVQTGTEPSARGGMCAALEVPLDGGAYLMITDAEDALSWEPGEGRGWGVGLYPAGDRDGSDGPLAFDTTDARDLTALVELCGAVLRQARGTLRAAQPPT